MTKGTTTRAATPRPQLPRATSARHASRLDADSHGLTATFVWDSGPAGAPHGATVRVSGRRTGVAGRREARDDFVREERVGPIAPNSGPVSLTTRVNGINAGEWSVTAELARTPPRTLPRGGSRSGRDRNTRKRVSPGTWSWRHWKVRSTDAATICTRWAPMTALTGAPAVVPGSYVGFIAVGVALALVVQARLVVQRGIGGGAVLVTSAVAVLAGILGAKLWYVADRAGRDRASGPAGWCIQGFLAGAIVALAGGVWLFGLPIGVVLDATAPALFAGLAIGRLGCFFTGCCAGRPSASRWAVWSSDRRVGARRIPTQLLESLAAAGIATAGYVLYRDAAGAGSGAVLAAAMAAYTLVRQILLRLRAAPRKSSARGVMTAVAAGLVLVVSAGVLLAG